MDKLLILLGPGMRGGLPTRSRTEINLLLPMAISKQLGMMKEGEEKGAGPQTNLAGCKIPLMHPRLHESASSVA